jgi:hypothetical protein
MPAQAAASVASRGGLIKVGAEVAVAPGWEGIDHAKKGPLRPGVKGKVIKDDLSGHRPWLVTVSHLSGQR